MINKRGQMQIETLIAVIVGVLVLAFVVYGFATNWSIFKSVSGSNNVDTIVTQCQTACATASTYGFCSQPRDLKAEDLPGGVKDIFGNCTYFSTDAAYAKYGISPCPAVTCSS